MAEEEMSRKIRAWAGRYVNDAVKSSAGIPPWELQRCVQLCRSRNSEFKGASGAFALCILCILCIFYAYFMHILCILCVCIILSDFDSRGLWCRHLHPFFPPARVHKKLSLLGPLNRRQWQTPRLGVNMSQLAHRISCRSEANSILFRLE